MRTDQAKKQVSCNKRYGICICVQVVGARTVMSVKSVIRGRDINRMNLKGKSTQKKPRSWGFFNSF